MLIYTLQFNQEFLNTTDEKKNQPLHILYLVDIQDLAANKSLFLPIAEINYFIRYIFLDKLIKSQ